jgi:UDPglucose 6-dehydrogenase
MKLAVIGTGYVGLVSGTCFAETGNYVICVDIDAQKVARMKAGEVPIYEPGLATLFERNTEAGRLHFTTDLAAAIEDADIIFLALPTPPDEDGSADLSYVLGVASQLSLLIKSYKVIVDKSTVPVGTAERVHNLLAQNLSPDLFDVVSNPEFLREGVAVDDFLKPDRVVLGTTSERARRLMSKLYEPFLRQGNPIIFMDERSAEMTKYTANSYLATRISFMNEIANLCEKLGADVDMVRKGIGADFRIGKHFLYSGLGYGGSCFPKDVKALSKMANDQNYDFQILNAVMQINDLQRQLFVEKIMRYYKDDVRGKVFAIWGLSFKPNTDDIREAPALYVIDQLLRQGATVRVFDPEAMPHVKTIYTDEEKVVFCQTQYQACADADALLIMTEWNVFRTPDFEQMATQLRYRVIFDGRNVYDPKYLEESGFYYESIGRPLVKG